MQHSTTSEFRLIRKEQESLNARFEKCKSGKGAFVLITGKAGSGKSTLVKQFCEYIVSERAVCISIDFKNDSKLSPYKPFIDAIEAISHSKQLSEFFTQHNEDQSGNQADSAARSDLQYLLGIQSNQTIIQQNIVLALFRLAEKQTIVFSLDNTHLASQTTWRFIHYLAEKIAEKPILMLATLRMDGRLSNDNMAPAYSDVLQRMNRDGVIEKIRLQSLKAAELSELLRNRYNKSDFSSELVPLLMTNSNGNIARILELLNCFEKEKIIYPENGIWFDRIFQNGHKLCTFHDKSTEPENYMEQFEVLDAQQQKLLEYASLFYENIDCCILASLLGDTRINTLRMVNKLILNKVLYENKDQSFSFTDLGFKHFILSRIADETKINHHQKMAGLISDSMPDSDQKTNILAFHYLNSFQHDMAVIYLLRSIEIAIKNFALVEAKMLFEKLFGLEKNTTSEITKLNIIHAHLKAAWLYRILGQYETSLSHCNCVERDYADAQDDYVILQSRIQKTFTLFRLQKWQEARQIIDKCKLRSAELSAFDKSMLNYGMGNILFEISDYPGAKEYYSYALEMAEKINNKSLIALVLSNIATTESVSGNVMKAISLYSKAIPIYEELGDQYGLARIYNDIGMTYADSESWEKANEFYGKSLSKSDVLGLNWLKQITFLNKAIALLGMDRVEEAGEYNFKAFRLIELFKDRLAMAEYWKIKGMIAARHKKHKEAEQCFQNALQGFSEFKNKLGQAEIYTEHGKYLIELNDLVTATELLKKAMAIFNDIGARKKAKSIGRILSSISSLEYDHTAVHLA